MTKKNLEKFVDNLKKIKHLDKMIEILKKEIEDNLFDKNEKTLINFTLVKKEVVESDTSKYSGGLLNMIMEQIDTHEATVTNVRYTEDFEISEDFATKVQLLLLKDLKKQRRDAIKELEANESTCRV